MSMCISYRNSEGGDPFPYHLLVSQPEVDIPILYRAPVSEIACLRPQVICMICLDQNPILLPTKLQYSYIMFI